MMVIPVFCGLCIKSSIYTNTMYLEEHMVPVAEIMDEPVYDVHCAKGHNYKCLVMNEKFELLFDLGFNALIDGYYREAVSSFASALERFYEFTIRLFLIENVERQAFDEAWKKVSNQSERQTGAFIFLYLSKLKTAPLLLPEKDASFRNKVIHKGYIPSKDEAAAFGETIRSLVNDAIKSIRTLYGEKLASMYESQFEEIKARENIEFTCTITPILDARNGPVFGSDDVRNKSLLEIIPAAVNRRSPQKMRLFKDRNDLEAARKELEEKESAR